MAISTFRVGLTLVLLSMAVQTTVAQISGSCGAAEGYEPRTRNIWLVIEETDWNYTPDGRNLIKDVPFSDVFTELAESAQVDCH